MESEQPVTVLLEAWKAGDRTALDRLILPVYAELRRIAASCLRREPGTHTLQPTALVHEAYMRLAGTSDPGFSNRAHFLGVAARLMRQILVDHARARNTSKRSGGARVPLNDEIAVDGRHAALVMSLDEGLDDLERQDPEKARILELKYFGGMTAKDSAEALGVSVHKVNRQMRLAQAWMRRALKAHAEPPLGGSD